MIRQATRVAGAALLTCAAAVASAQERPARTPQTDRTVTVAKGSRLSVSNDAGEVVLRTWDKDSLRVQASHNSRATIDIQTTGNIVSVRSRSAGGPVGAVDYEITAPAWLPVKVSGQFIYIGIEGAQNEVSAETVRGDIVIKGGSGIVTAKSVQGEVIVEDAKGRINASSINEGVRISGAVGDITAETTNGDISLTKVDAKSIEVTTINGDIQLRGACHRRWTLPPVDPQRRHHDDSAGKHQRHLHRAHLQRRLQQQSANQSGWRNSSRTTGHLHDWQRRSGSRAGELRG